MRILHVTPSYKPAWVYGGPIFSSGELCEGLAEVGHDVTVYTTTANGNVELDVTPGRATDVNGIGVHYFKRWTKDHTHLSPSLIWKLFTKCKSFDAVHIHSWWNTVAVLGAIACLLRGVTPVVSPRGMLSDYSFGRSKTSIKTLFHRSLGKLVLARSKIHVTSQAEEQEIDLPREKTFVIHNIVELPESLPRLRNDKFKIGFLSRIDPKKNLELLFQSLANTGSEYELVIAGSGETIYVNELKELAHSLSLQNKIQWLGRLDSEKKFRLLASLDLFVLLSHNENFANVVVESLAMGTPVLLSDKIGLSDFVTGESLGWITSVGANDAEKIGRTIRKLGDDSDKRRDISIRAPALVRKRFGRAALIPEYVQMYRC